MMLETLTSISISNFKTTKEATYGNLVVPPLVVLSPNQLSWHVKSSHKSFIRVVATASRSPDVKVWVSRKRRRSRSWEGREMLMLSFGGKDHHSSKEREKRGSEAEMFKNNWRGICRVGLRGQVASTSICHVHACTSHDRPVYTSSICHKNSLSTLPMSTN